MENEIVYTNILKAAWKGLLSQFWLLVGLLIGFVIIYSLLIIFAIPGKGETLTVSGAVVILLSILLYGLFVMGYLKNCFQTLDGEEPQFSAYGQASRRLPAFIVAYIIYIIAVSVGFALLVLPGVYVGLRLSFYPAAMVDENTGLVQSFRRSWEITRKHTFRLFVLSVIIFLVTLAGQLALVAGIFVATPLALLMYGYAFRKLTDPTGKTESQS